MGFKKTTNFIFIGGRSPGKTSLLRTISNTQIIGTPTLFNENENREEHVMSRDGKSILTDAPGLLNIDTPAIVVNEIENALLRGDLQKVVFVFKEQNGWLIDRDIGTMKVINYALHSSGIPMSKNFSVFIECRNISEAQGLKTRGSLLSQVCHEIGFTDNIHYFFVNPAGGEYSDAWILTQHHNYDTLLDQLPKIHTKKESLRINPAMIYFQRAGSSSMLPQNHGSFQPSASTTTGYSQQQHRNTQRFSIHRCFVFLGNSGCGKSTLLNTVAEQPLFQSGSSSSSALTVRATTREVSLKNISLVDTPGVGDFENLENATKEVDFALKSNGKISVVFVLTVESGSFRSTDIGLVRAVVLSLKESGTDMKNRYGIILNKIKMASFERNEKKLRSILCNVNVPETKHIFGFEKIEHFVDLDNGVITTHSDILTHLIGQIPSISPSKARFSFNQHVFIQHVQNVSSV